MSTGIISDFFLRRSTFFPDIEQRNFVHSSKHFGGFVKTVLSVLEIILRRNNWFEIFSFSSFPGNERKFSGLLARIFRRRCQNCLLIVLEIFFSKKILGICCLTISDNGRIFLGFSQDLFGTVVKTAYYVAIGTVWGKKNEIRESFFVDPFRPLSEIFLDFSSKVFPKSCPNCILRVLEIIFSKKNVFCLLFSDIEQNFLLPSGKKLLARSLQLNSTCREDYSSVKRINLM